MKNKTKYLPIIGMEIHVEPLTKSKMFCECPADHFGKPANSHTCPVCLGLPGALPIPNQTAIDACLKLGLALNCQINLQSKFDRKNYTYPDLPKAYQISQYDLPFCYQGNFEFPDISNIAKLSTVGITRIHMEEDTGKNQHITLNNQKVSLIDYNRSGVPLIEIVTEPDLHSPEQTKQFLKWLVKTIEFLDISECNMETGALRLEANISVAQIAEDTFDPNNIPLPPYKVEIKNVNSFRYIEKAIEYEINRHIQILESGKYPTQETRGYNENKDETFSQRSKEESQDYRYFPEPDIPPINTDIAKISLLKKQLTYLPVKLAEKLSEYQIKAEYIPIILSSKSSYQKFIDLINQNNTQLTVAEIANIIINQKINLEEISSIDILNQITSKISKYTMTESQIHTIVTQVLSEHPTEVLKYKEGKTQLLGFFVGQVSKNTKGQADPKLISQITISNLNK